jgi:RNA-binding protein 18
MILKLFSPFGKIAREDFFWHMQGEKRGVPRGYCFVEYEKREVCCD